MKKHSIDDSSERLRKLWLAYESPGRLVLRDIARLGRMLERAYSAISGRGKSYWNEEEAENHLWAERRD